jgi:predicted component of type VI protein secretion system
MNPSKLPAIGLKLNLRDPMSNKIILPAYFSDGYFTMLPGEKRQIEVDCISKNTQNIAIVAEGYNLKQQLLFVTR